MEDELWNKVYRVVMKTASTWSSRSRPGHPDEYEVWEIALLWLWTALWNQPLTRTLGQLGSRKCRRGLVLLGFRLPMRVPHESTMYRRVWRSDYADFIAAVNQALIAQLYPVRWRLLVDSSPLPVPHVSHDVDATWGHHRQRGYRWHTLVSSDRVVLHHSVQPANVHELRVAPLLVKQAGEMRRRPKFVIGDDGYDSEPLHRSVRRELPRARLIAPLNDRGGQRTMRRTPLRRWLNAHWDDPAVARAYRVRPEIDRMYSVLKSHRFGLYALPPWVRHLPAVTRWVELKMVLYHAYLTLRRRRKAA
jgi:hypothetical protein